MDKREAEAGVREGIAGLLTMHADSPRADYQKQRDIVLRCVEQGECGGVCLVCNFEYYGIEQDTAGAWCEECGCAGVYGAERYLIEIDCNSIEKGDA